MLQHKGGQMFEAIWRGEKLTVGKALPEDGADESRNASGYWSNGVTWCIKDCALSVGLMKAK